MKWVEVDLRRFHNCLTTRNESHLSMKYQYSDITPKNQKGVLKEEISPDLDLMHT